MASLEKKMFFLPSRLAVSKDRIYVAFNLSVVPRDMAITSMSLHIQLPKFYKPSTITISPLISGWSEASIKKGILPARSKTIQQLKFIPGKREQLINVAAYKTKWRQRKLGNHGIYICFKDKQLQYVLTHPPYLVIDTI